jgi:hypothetical protein
MSNVYSFGVLSKSDEAEARQLIVDDIKEAMDGLINVELFPMHLKKALAGNIWEHERKLHMSVVKPMSLHEFIYKRYPEGLGTNYDTIEKLISGDAEAMDAWQQATKRGAGAPLGNHNAAKVKDETTLDNIQDCLPPSAPTGTSAQAGLRRLRKAADEGDTRAREQHDAVLRGETSVHAACVELGWRKKTVTLQDEPVVLFNAAVAKAGPLETAMRAWLMMSQEDRAQLLDWQSQNPV